MEIALVANSAILGNRLRKGVAELAGCPMRQAFHDVRLQGMIARVAAVVAQTNAPELRAYNNEVLRKTRFEQNPARLAARNQRGVRVNEIGEAANVAIGEESIGRCRSAQRLSGGQSCCADGARSG